MTKLYLIRHGATEYNQLGIFQGSIDIELDKLGNTQAELLGKRFKDIELDVIYTSPQLRAKQTAQAIHKYHKNIDLIEKTQLKEMDGGLLEGNTMAENTERYNEAIQAMQSNPAKFCAPNGESTKDIYIRIIDVINEIVKDNPNNNIAVVSHGFLIRAFLCYAQKTPFEQMKGPVVGNTSVTTLMFADYDNPPIIVSLGDDSHIPDEFKFDVNSKYSFR